MLFRVYAGIRAGQLLHQLSQLTGHWQCGFTRHKKATDVWFFVNICVELALQEQEPVHGIVADLVRAYNTLPRAPIFTLLQHCGVPSWFISMWKHYLIDFQRYFIVRRCTSLPQLSATGFPEGCPLSCVAMSCIDWLWHIWQHHRVPRALAISYVDNLSVLPMKSIPFIAVGFRLWISVPPWTCLLTTVNFMPGRLLLRGVVSLNPWGLKFVWLKETWEDRFATLLAFETEC